MQAGTVLVVDDDYFNVQLMKDMLSKVGVQSMSAKNGLEALESYKVNHEKINLVLMDWEMMIMDGPTATSEILKHCAQKDICPPVIYGLTGHQKEKYLKKGLEVGMKDVITKPVTLKVFMELIGKEIHGKDLKGFGSPIVFKGEKTVTTRMHTL